MYEGLRRGDEADALQWGRLMDEAESLKAAVTASDRVIASMGPPHG